MIQEGARFCDSIRDCVKDGCGDDHDCWFSKDVEEVYFEEGNILDSVKQGTILIDMTTTSPQIAKAI